MPTWPTLAAWQCPRNLCLALDVGACETPVTALAAPARGTTNCVRGTLPCVEVDDLVRDDELVS